MILLFIWPDALPDTTFRVYEGSGSAPQCTGLCNLVAINSTNQWLQLTWICVLGRPGPVPHWEPYATRCYSNKMLVCFVALGNYDAMVRCKSLGRCSVRSHLAWKR